MSQDGVDESKGGGESGKWPAWVDQEFGAAAHLRGSAQLEKWEQIATRLGTEGRTELQVEVLHGMMSSARTIDDIQWKIRIVAELRRIHASGASGDWLVEGILWYLKWIGTDIADYMQVPAETIAAVHNDIEAFYREQGEPLRPVYAIRLSAALSMGRREDATRWFELWMASEKASTDDCAACLAGLQLDYYHEMQDDENLFKTARALLKMDSSCDFLPAIVSKVIPYFARHDFGPVAEKLHRGTVRAVRTTPNMLGMLSAHILYLAIAGDVQRGRRLVASGLWRSRQLQAEVTRFRIIRAAGFWAALTCAIKPKEAAPLSLPERCLHSRSAVSRKTVPLPEVAAECLGEAQTLAAGLDARNGNDHYQKSLHDTLESFKSLVEQLEKGDTGLRRRE
jgi:hypothetical protein